MKTVDGILREMRELAKEVQGNSISNAYELLMGLADRIEAAHKREVAVAENATTTPTCEKSSQVGNAAAVREALERLREWVLMDLNENAFISDSSGNYMKLIKGTIEIANAALAEPPRNCDVYTKAQLCEMVTEEIKSELDTDIPQGIIDIIEIVAKGMIKGLFAEAKGEQK